MKEAVGSGRLFLLWKKGAALGRPQALRSAMEAKQGLGRPCRGVEPPAPAVKVWFVDLDDTLMESSGGMLHAIHLRMNAFISEALGMSWEEAGKLRTAYWAKYGSTFIGLWRHHRIDPCVFLPATHDFDYAPFVSAVGSPAADLRALRRRGVRLVLFTNGPRPYAEGVLRLLGLRDAFDEVVSSTDMRLFGEWRPKPSATMLRALCARLRVRPREAALIDDSPANLRTAKSIGMRTFWCTGYRARHGKLTHRRLPPGVDHVVLRLRDLAAYAARRKRGG